MGAFVCAEIKNRLIMLADVCVEMTQKILIAELMEVVASKSAVLRLVTERYEPQLEDVDYTVAIDARVKKYLEANRHVATTPTAGAAAQETSLRLDRTLLNIILDNLLSNVRGPRPLLGRVVVFLLGRVVVTY